jgi:glycosyltransferase involved in cell wall biosynthesis
MGILIAGHFIYTGRVGGSEHMVYNLTRGLSDLGVEVTFLCADRANLSAEFLEDSRIAHRTIIECGGKGSRFVSEQRACLDRRLRGTSILFPQYYLPPILPRRLGQAAVVIHDFQYRHFPQYFSAKKRAWLRLCHWRAFTTATKVIVVSDFVRRDAIRLYGQCAEKSIVIPNPVSWDRFRKTPGPHPFGERPYLLSVAAHYPHKRLDVLVKAFSKIAQKRKDLLLVLCGQLPEGLISVGKDVTGLRGLISDLGLNERVCITGYLSDQEVGDLYHHALAFAFPSVFEGFGMPAVEALGFGLPTLTTRCTSLPEVTLGMAHYVDDPSDTDEWAERLESLVATPRLPAETIERIRDNYDALSIGQRYLQALSTDWAESVYEVVSESTARF